MDGTPSRAAGPIRDSEMARPLSLLCEHVSRAGRRRWAVEAWAKLGREREVRGPSADKFYVTHPAAEEGTGRGCC